MSQSEKVRIFHVRQSVDQHLPYANEPDYFRHVEKQAAFALGEEMVKQASRHRQRETGPHIEHEWSVAVVMPDTADAFAKQLEEARRDGMREAAAIVMNAAAAYLGLDGPCGHVIKSALERTARQIEDARVSDGSPKGRDP